MISRRDGHGTLGILARLGLVFALSALAPPLAAAPPLWAESLITIMPNWVDPPTLRATLDERVTFVNRSGRMVYVQFIGDSGKHHVFQIPNQIWAEFHRPGRHPYIVQFPDGRGPDIHGVIEVPGDHFRRPDLQACAGVTVMGGCLER